MTPEAGSVSLPLVPEAEAVVSALIAALHATAQLFVVTARELRESEGWSSVSSTLEVVHWTTDGHAAISGSVEGEKAGLGALAWSLDLIRDGAVWRVERSLGLNTDTAGEQQTVTKMGTAEYDDSRALAADLPALVLELLDLRTPA
jgi:hypothetical protein